MNNPIFTAKVKKVAKENYRVATVEIDAAVDASPGQFLMVWVPGVGERPMSIGNANPLTISVANVGKVSGAISKLGAGDSISYRGPLGKGFSVPHNAKRILAIGGGYGVVPLYFLCRRAREQGLEAVAVVGARAARDIIYEKQLFAVCGEVFITTDDGSRGKRGNVMAEAEWLIAGKKFDAVYACGPEMMMKAVATLCAKHGTPCQVSVERYMKCGVGVCGSCAINGRLACVDGPVFNAAEALGLSEFGSAHRDATGRRR